ncbi:g8154 [Coccomyxa elongata]
MIAFFASEVGWQLIASGLHHDLCRQLLVLEIDLQVLRERTNSKDLIAAMECQPLECLACLSAASSETVFFHHLERAKGLTEGGLPDAKIRIRIVNYPESIMQIRSMKASAIGRLVSVCGTVVRIGVVRPQITQMDFTCNKCSTSSTCKFEDGKYMPPTACPGEGCRSKSFSPLKSSAHSIDWQKIRVQELQSAHRDSSGQIPRTIEIELKEDLVDSCTAGDVVTIVGIVKVINTEALAGGQKANNTKALFLLYIDAVSIVARRSTAMRTAKRSDGRFKAEEPDTEQMDESVPPNVTSFSNRDLQFIVKFHSDFAGHQFRHLVHALCPSIYGHELEKAGLVLALLGGVRKCVGALDAVPLRGDIHILMCGDPGLGKSQLLQAAAAVAPRGIYVCGNTSTSAGLTVTVVKDAVTGDHVFEAGALVLADRGACCIDEFEKMTSEHQALLAAMEQGEVAVARAGICATLPARTSVLAAANPVGGRWNRAKTVQQNLGLSAPMLSRFDLIFVMHDAPDAALDQRLSEHVLALHSGQVDRAHLAKQRLREQRAARGVPACSRANAGAGGRAPLEEQLLVYTAADEDPVPPQLLRKYIAYARAHVHPVLSNDAKQVLKEFYLELRRKAVGSVDSAPITTRQLESLVRLAEARARADLRQEVTCADAEDVVDIMKACLLDKLLDDTGVVDFRSTGSKSKQKEAKRFLGALAKRCQLAGSNLITTAQLYSLADDLDLAIPDTDTFIGELNEAGELLKKGGNSYQVQCVPLASLGSTQTQSQSASLQTRF